MKRRALSWFMAAALGVKQWLRYWKRKYCIGRRTEGRTEAADETSEELADDGFRQFGNEN